jgi:hypothetical protein
MPPKTTMPKKDSKHAIATRQRLLKKLSDPADKDDPRWVRAFLGHADARLARKEKAKSHRKEQKKVGRNRKPKQSIDS